MTRKDFILIATVINNMPTSLSEEQRGIIASRFAEELAWTNPQFNRELFIQAATGVVAVNARKAV